MKVHKYEVTIENWPPWPSGPDIIQTNIYIPGIGIVSYPVIGKDLTDGERKGIAFSEKPIDISTAESFVERGIGNIRVYSRYRYIGQFELPDEISDKFISAKAELDQAKALFTESAKNLIARCLGPCK